MSFYTPPSVRIRTYIQYYVRMIPPVLPPHNTIFNIYYGRLRTYLPYNLTPHKPTLSHIFVSHGSRLITARSRGSGSSLPSNHTRRYIPATSDQRPATSHQPSAISHHAQRKQICKTQSSFAIIGAGVLHCTKRVLVLVSVSVSVSV